jgi:hypothetical protein
VKFLSGVVCGWPTDIVAAVHFQYTHLHFKNKQNIFKRINQLDAAINCRFIVCRLDIAQHVLDILMPIIRSLSTEATSGCGIP